jgi:phage terminase large subunit GpA-like protein
MMGRVMELFAPPPDLTVSQWADSYRRLSPESSASPGRWYTSKVPYLKEPMDMVGRPGVRRISMMTSAQVAKTSFLENTLGYLMHQDPCPILVVMPTIDSVKMFSKERLAPMIRDTPVLRDKVKDPRSRDANNTLMSKQFPGGTLAMVGSNAPAGLASRPIRAVMCDEVDRFELSAGTEGDPINLAVKRTTTFWNRIVIFVSTPGDKGTSRIEMEFEAGDQRRYWCPCGDCGEFQTLKWSNVKWTDSDPDSAYYECEKCGSAWSDFQRNVAVKKGEWRAEKPFTGNVSYHLNQIYSPFAPLADGVRDFLAAKGNANLLKTWVNTFLGETWEDEGARLDWSDVMDHREEYTHPVPADVTLITGAVDVQDDRFEVEFVGWGDDYRSWSLGYHKIYGDLSTPQPWQDLRSLLSQSFVHPVFGEIATRMTCMDSGGHYTTDVYKFTQTVSRVAAIKGVGGVGKPMVGKPGRSNLGGAQVFPLGVDTIKEIVVQRLKVRKEGEPGYCAFPADRTEEYFRGLTAETLITRFVKGFKRTEWVKVRPRNEPFDCRVYATAALEMLQIDLNAQRRAALRAAMRRVNKQVTEVTPTPKKPAPKRSQPSWADRWRSDD